MVLIGTSEQRLLYPDINWPLYLSHACSVVATACIKSRPGITAVDFGKTKMSDLQPASSSRVESELRNDVVYMLC